jgi:hypothetical protein
LISQENHVAFPVQEFGHVITGDLNDTTFQQRLQQNTDILAVYCKQAKVAPSPTKQTFVHDVPAMPPLPSPAP